MSSNKATSEAINTEKLSSLSAILSLEDQMKHAPNAIKETAISFLKMVFFNRLFKVDVIKTERSHYLCYSTLLKKTGIQPVDAAHLSHDEFTKMLQSLSLKLVAKCNNFFESIEEGSNIVDWAQLDSLYEDVNYYWRAVVTATLAIMQSSHTRMQQIMAETAITEQDIHEYKQDKIQVLYPPISLKKQTPKNWEKNIDDSAPSWAADYNEQWQFTGITRKEIIDATLDEFGVLAKENCIDQDVIDEAFLAKIYDESVLSAYPGMACYLEDMSQKSVIYSNASEKYIKATSITNVNYYHWIVEVLGNLILLKDLIGKHKVILPTLTTAFHYESLTLFNINYTDSVTIPKNCVINPKSLLTSSISDKKQSYHPEHLKAISRFFLDETQTVSLEASKLIYIQRNSNRRAIVNEEEVCKALEEKGFTAVDPGKLPFVEQIKLFRQAKCIVSIHGAALTNCLFMHAGTSLVEIRNTKVDEIDQDSQCHFHLIASVLDINYYYVGGGSDADDKKPLAQQHHDNLSVDVSLLSDIVDTAVV